MLNLLYKYLITHKTVGIPGVGNFSIEYVPAALSNTHLQPPLNKINFTAGTALTDKNFYHFLATEKNITEVDAVRLFQDFAYNLKRNIQNNPSLELSGVGVLSRNQLGETVFKPEQLLSFFPSIHLQEVSLTTTTEEENVIVDNPVVVEEDYHDEETVVKDRWWIWATVLALLALALIGYFYSQENF